MQRMIDMRHERIKFESRFFKKIRSQKVLNTYRDTAISGEQENLNPGYLCTL